jgi:hypothetical protein
MNNIEYDRIFPNVGYYCDWLIEKLECDVVNCNYARSAIKHNNKIIVCHTDLVASKVKFCDQGKEKTAYE